MVANPQMRLTGMEPLRGGVNYFIGNDPRKWKSRVPAHRRIRYYGVYPGIDLVFHEAGANLEFDFILA
jgi:hypothetical protein